MRKWLIAGGMVLAVALAIIMGLWGAVVGVGYVVKGSGIVKVEAD